jgi:hypothetical protein
MNLTFCGQGGCRGQRSEAPLQLIGGQGLNGGQGHQKQRRKRNQATTAGKGVDKSGNRRRKAQQS